MTTSITFAPLEERGPALKMSAAVSETINESGTSQQSANAAENSTALPFGRIIATAAIRYATGSNPTATATSALLAANQVEFVALSPGDKIAVITA